MTEALLFRGALAEAALDGRVAADRYVELEALQALVPSAFIRSAPEFGSEALGQLLFGERFEVLEQEGAFVFGRALRDGCIGWADAHAIGAPSIPTHRVQSLRAFAYAEPDSRAPPAGPLALNALVSVHTGQGRWLNDPTIGWLAEGDLAPIGQGFETDVAAVALRFMGAPYLHGARDGIGIDAPGLVQQAFYACGLACPRSVDAQRATGRAVDDHPRRGDLAFWGDQVGLMLDAERLVTVQPYGVVSSVARPQGEIILCRPRS